MPPKSAHSPNSLPSMTMKLTIITLIMLMMMLLMWVIMLTMTMLTLIYDDNEDVVVDDDDVAKRTWEERPKLFITGFEPWAML